jgi:hypothetical protein
MEDVVVQPGLSQVERVVDTFVAPSKTFTDILRSANWLLPAVFMVLVGLVFSAAVQQKVGWDAVGEQQTMKNHFAADQINALPPAQRAAQLHAAGVRTKWTAYFFIVPTLIFAAIISLLWWVSINFGFGASTKFSQIFAIWMYAALPKSVMALIAACLLFGNVGVDNFDLQNTLGSNPGYYMSDAGAGVKAALGFFDIFGLWSLALAVIGVAIVARKSKGQAAAVVVGWWLFGLALSAGLAAAFG